MVVTINLRKSGDEFCADIYEFNLIHIEFGKTVADIDKKIRMALKDHFNNEGKSFKKISVDKITFKYKYDLACYFKIFKVLKKNKVAKLAGINRSLLAQYISGEKTPSKKQLQKIQDAIHELARHLMEVKII